MLTLEEPSHSAGMVKFPEALEAGYVSVRYNKSGVPCRVCTGKVNIAVTVSRVVRS